jgi:putative two-component system response regulator
MISNTIASLTTRESPIDWDSTLTSLQREVRERLSFEARVDESWIRDVADRMLQMQSSTSVFLQVDIMILLSDWYEDRRDRRFALRLLEGARDVAAGVNALSAKRRALNTLGTFHNRGKNTADAMTCYAEALQIAEQLGDRLGRCAVLANMAALRFNMGMLDDSIKLATLVIELCGSEGVLAQLKTQAHHVVAEASVALSDPVTAAHHLSAALRGALEPGNRSDATKRVLLEATFVRALVSMGQLTEAQRHVDLANTYALKAETFTARVQAQLSTALCEAASGTWDIALTRLASLESEIPTTDISFRDLVHVELFSNLQAGRKQYARYYDKKYLFSLAQFQRKTAIAQVANVKRYLKDVERAERKASNIVSVFYEKLEALASVAELREDTGGEHAHRVGSLVRFLATKLGYSDADACAMEHAARLHDIGKLATPDAILLKRGKLSVAETEIIRRHPTEGSQILTDVLYTVEATDINQSDEMAIVLRLASEIAQYHHEFWDGSGYPYGIAGKLIPESARLVALADAFDELTHATPYKKPSTLSESLTKIEALSGKQFDPELTRVFVGVVDEFSNTQVESTSILSEFHAANRAIKRLVSDRI